MIEPASARPTISPTVKRLGLVSLFSDIASDMIVPLLPIFLVGVLHASNAFVGLIDGTADTVSSALKVFAGRLSDKRGQRKPLVVGGYSIATLVRPFMALATAPWQVLTVRILDRVGKGMRGAPRDAWIANVTPREHVARAYGYHRAMDNLGGCLGPLFGLLLYKGFDLPLRWVFALSAVPGVIAVGILLTTKESGELADAPAPTSNAPSDSTQKMPWALRLFFVVLLVFTLGNASDSFIVLQAKAVGASDAMVLILWTAFTGLRALLSSPGSLLSDRIGRPASLLLGWVLFAIVYYCFSIAGTFWVFVPVLALYSFHYGLVEGAERALIADLAPSAKRGFAFGVFYGTVGVGALPASLMFGAIADRFDLARAFQVSAGLALFAALLLLALIRYLPSRSRK